MTPAVKFWVPVEVAGPTGATAATRYAGATASGAPASGTFLKGDFIIDQTGKVYICTVSGSPGTWVSAASGAGTGSSWSVLTDGVVATPALVFAGGDVIMVQS